MINEEERKQVLHEHYSKIANKGWTDKRRKAASERMKKNNPTRILKEKLAKLEKEAQDER